MQLARFVSDLKKLGFGTDQEINGADTVDCVNRYFGTLSLSAKQETRDQATKKEKPQYTVRDIPTLFEKYLQSYAAWSGTAKSIHRLEKMKLEKPTVCDIEHAQALADMNRQLEENLQSARAQAHRLDTDVTEYRNTLIALIPVFGVWIEVQAFGLRYVIGKTMNDWGGWHTDMVYEELKKGQTEPSYVLNAKQTCGD